MTGTAWSPSTDRAGRWTRRAGRVMRPGGIRLAHAEPRRARGCRRLPLLAVLALVALVAAAGQPAPTAHGATTVSGVIASNTTWTLGGSPYVVTTSVRVLPGVTLTIEPGVQVRFDGPHRLQIDGQLVAIGTPGSRILFASNKPDPQPGDWHGIVFTRSSGGVTFDGGGSYLSGNVLRYADVMHGGTVIAYETNAYFDNNTFTRNQGINPADIYPWGTAVVTIDRSNGTKFTNNVLMHNANPVLFGGAANVEFSRNIIYRNNQGPYSGGIEDNWGGPVNLTRNIVAENIGIALRTRGTNTVSDNAFIGGASWLPEAPGGPQQDIGLDMFQGTGSTYTNNVITRFRTAAIRAEPVSVQIHSSNIVNNGGDYDFDISAPRSNDLVGNFWGLTSPSAVHARIRNRLDQFGQVVVVTDPIATAPIPTTPIVPPTGLTASGNGNSIALAWSPVAGQAVVGYRVYYGTTSGWPYAQMADAGNSTSFTLNGLSPGRYYVAVTAYRASRSGTDVAGYIDGHESWFSAELDTRTDTSVPTISSFTLNNGDAATATRTVLASIAAADAGSGLAGLRLRTDGSEWQAWQPFAPIVAVELPPGDGAKAVYAMVRDQVGNESAVATDTIVLDSSASLSSFRINEGAAATNSPEVTLTIAASDPASGLSSMRFSNDGTAWSEWVPFATSSPWSLPGGDGPKSAYAQVRDGLGNVSPSLSDTIVLETVPPTLGALVLNGGAASTTSPNVTLALQASDPAGGTGLAGMQFSNDGGSSWSAWEPYATTRSWTLAAGPDGPRTVQARVRDAAGNESAVLADEIELHAALGTLYGVSISESEPGSNWSRTTDVELTIAAPANTAGMMVSNDGGFGGAAWEPFASRKPWQLLPYRDREPITRIVYVRFRDVNGVVANGGAAVIDDIVLDVRPPRTHASVPTGQEPRAGRAGPRLVWQVAIAADDADPLAERVSGVAHMRLSNRPDFAGAHWQPYNAGVAWDFSGGTTVYVQTRDLAGNVSEAVAASVPGTTPSPGTSPSPSSCAPRPRIEVAARKDGPTLLVTLATTGPNNGLRAVRFDSFQNAVVDVVDGSEQRNQTAPFALSIPPGQEPTSLRFAVRRQTPGQATTVRLVVFDGCGEWSTFVGGGPDAF